MIRMAIFVFTTFALACGEDLPTSVSEPTFPPRQISEPSNPPSSPSIPEVVTPSEYSTSNDGAQWVVQMTNTIGWDTHFGAACYVDGDAPIASQKLVDGDVKHVRSGKSTTLYASLDCGRVHQCDFFVGIATPLTIPDYGGHLIQARRVVADECEKLSRPPMPPIVPPEPPPAPPDPPPEDEYICHVSNKGKDKKDWNLQEQTVKATPGHVKHLNTDKFCPPDYWGECDGRSKNWTPDMCEES